MKLKITKTVATLLLSSTLCLAGHGPRASVLIRLGADAGLGGILDVGKIRLNRVVGKSDN